MIQRRRSGDSTGFRRSGSAPTQLQPSPNSNRTKPKKILRRGDHRQHRSAAHRRRHPPVGETALLRAFVRGALPTPDENCPACYADGFHFLFLQFLSHFPKALVSTLGLTEPEQRRCQENSRLQSCRSQSLSGLESRLDAQRARVCVCVWTEVFYCSLI